MKYRSFKLSARDRVAQNRILAGLVSAAIVDIWRNVVGILPGWDDSAVLPSKFCVGSSSQLLVFCLDSIDNMIHSRTYLTAEDLAQGLTQTIKVFERGLADPGELCANFLGQQLSEVVVKEQAWQRFRAPLISLSGREANFIEYLPIAFSALALDSNWGRAKQVLCYLSEKFQIDLNCEYIWQTWMAFHRKEDLIVRYQNLEKIILDFEISPAEAMVAAFNFGLKDGLKTFYNSWPNRMDVFEVFEVLANRLVTNLNHH